MLTLSKREHCLRVEDVHPRGVHRDPHGVRSSIGQARPRRQLTSLRRRHGGGRVSRETARAQEMSQVTKTAHLAARRTSFPPGARLIISADLPPACLSRAYRFSLVDSARQRVTGPVPPATTGPPCARYMRPPGGTTAATFRPAAR